MMKKWMVAACFVVLAAQADDAGAAKAVEERITAAAGALKSFRENATDTTRKLFDAAICIAVTPKRTPEQTTAGGLGFVSCREKPGAAWSQPAAIVIEGGGIYWPVVGADSAVVLLAMNLPAATHLAASRIIFSSEVDAVPGPTRPEQMPLLRHYPELFTYVSSPRGVSAVQLAGATWSEDTSVNASIYGRTQSNRAVLQLSAATPVLLSVEELRGALPPSGAGVIQKEAVTAKRQ